MTNAPTSGSGREQERPDADGAFPASSPAVPPNRALAYVLFSLLLLVIVPLIMDRMADTHLLPPADISRAGDRPALPAMRFYLTLALGALSIFAGYIVYRTQQYIQRNAEEMRRLAASNARRVRELETLFSIAQRLSLQGGAERVYGHLTEQVALLFGAEKCGIWLYDDLDRTLRPQPPAFDLDDDRYQTIRLFVHPDDVLHRVLYEDAVIVSDRLEREEWIGPYRPYVEEMGLRSALMVRLSASGRQIGVLAVYNKNDGTSFNDEEARLLQTFAGQAAFAIHSARMIEQARQRNELLGWAMKETHHRIKNNLQAVSAILDMQTMGAGEDTIPVETLREVLRQIRAIATVHDLLSADAERTRQGAVSAREAMERLLPVVTLGRADRRIRIDLDIEDIQLPARIVTSLALTINELISNAVKHAAGANRAVTVSVSLSQDADQLCLVVQDDGPGFPAGFEVRRDGGSGLDLVRILVERDLSGELRFTGAPGARVEARLPIAGASWEKVRNEYQHPEFTGTDLRG